MTTVAEVTAVVTDRCVAHLAQARVLTGDPTKPGTAPAIGWAVRMLGGTTASLTTVTDGEVQAIASGLTDALLDLSELRTLESVQTNLTAVDVTAGPVQQAYSDLAERLVEIVEQKRKLAQNRWGAYLTQPLTDAVKRATLRVL